MCDTAQSRQACGASLDQPRRPPPRRLIPRAPLEREARPVIWESVESLAGAAWSGVAAAGFAGGAVMAFAERTVAAVLGGLAALDLTG
jgi:hypothetical protein